MAECGGITIGAVYDCDNPLTPGLNNRVWLGNISDLESVTLDVSNKNLATGLVFKSGGALYVFDGTRQSTNADSEFIAQTLSVGYAHGVQLQVFDISSAQKANLQKMCLGKMFAVVEHPNVAGNADAVFELFGASVGMEVLTLTRISRDTETQGSYSLALRTSENEGQEAKLPLSFFDTDYATTLAKIVGYETPAP